MQQFEIPKWLQEARDNPPPAPDPEEVAESERLARYAEMGPLRDRLPRFLVTAKPAELVARVEDERLKRVARTWVPQHGNVALLGETDVGKSTAAGIICRRVIHEGVRLGGSFWDLAQGIRWFRAMRLEKEAREHPLGKGECQALRLAEKAKLLVIDDLGWERDHKFIADILAERFDSPRLTIITSGLTMDGYEDANGNWVSGLRDKYGDAVVKRIITTRGRGAVLVSAFPELEEAARRKRLAEAHNPTPFNESAERFPDR